MIERQCTNIRLLIVENVSLDCHEFAQKDYSIPIQIKVPHMCEKIYVCCSQICGFSLAYSM